MYGAPPAGPPESRGQWYVDLKRKNEELSRRAEYLQHEINEMRRAMQDAGIWEKFCAGYAAYKERKRA